ncbi:DUF2853 family protein [Chelativorans sp. YIM 93263]|uniref:DUF2853 family protein n=1 Tax=Chelativorans sp. YIM 93263 TaxID=2906648 RepID=UPI002379688A|nr:DUF2853 family protein [Chelativorans sp. YIM 93263]
MQNHIEDVKKYHADANEDVVGKIVSHLGIALRNRDSALVSCTDPEELARVRESWCKKHLGETDDTHCDSVIEKVCETMSGDRAKNRVTFYYLTAKHLNKLTDL